jgi:hypothetical protein
MSRELTPAERHFVDTLCAKLPPAVAREEVRKLLGGMVSPHTVKFYDLKGKGPAGAYRVGRKVVYLTRSLLEWLVLDYGVTPLGTLDDLLAEDSKRPAA